MGNWSKLIGTLVGGLLGLAINFGLIPDGTITADVQSALVVLLAGIGTALFPPNVKPA